MKEEAYRAVKPIHDEPGENGAYKAHGDGAEVERERVARADTGLLEEVDKLTGESETTAVSTLQPQESD